MGVKHIGGANTSLVILRLLELLTIGAIELHVNFSLRSNTLSVHVYRSRILSSSSDHRSNFIKMVRNNLDFLSESPLVINLFWHLLLLAGFDSILSFGPNLAEIEGVLYSLEWLEVILSKL